MSSNDGFSVVAPIKVSSPRSTNGRNASCCALLKRCTSSTKSIVCRPDCASTASACATASRMSFTPASTAEMERKSALNASAISRASEVLPVPGGPQRIIECGLPELKATASGLPRPSRCRWPMNSASVFGRNRSASGVAGLATANRSVADDIGARRRGKPEQVSGQLRIAFQFRETDQRALPEVVVDLERSEPLCVEAETDFGEGGFLVLRRCPEPLEPIGGGQVAPVKRALHVVLACEQRRGRRPKRLVVLALDDLIQVGVIDPDPIAVAHQQLLVRFVHTPAELARPRDHELAARLLLGAAVLVGYRLGERRARSLRIVHERAQSLNGRSVRKRRDDA